MILSASTAAAVCSFVAVAKWDSTIRKFEKSTSRCGTDTFVSASIPTEPTIGIAPAFSVKDTAAYAVIVFSFFQLAICGSYMATTAPFPAWKRRGHGASIAGGGADDAVCA